MSYKDQAMWLRTRKLHVVGALPTPELTQEALSNLYEMCMTEGITGFCDAKAPYKYLEKLQPRADHPIAFRCKDKTIIVSYHNYDDKRALDRGFVEGPEIYYPGWAKSYYRRFRNCAEINRARKNLV